MTNKFIDKIIIITGASSGIGKACAFKFADKGATVVLASRNYNNLKRIENEINALGGKAYSVETDVRNSSDCKLLIDKTIDKYDKIDILINNAGISMRAKFEDLDLSVVKELMDTNFNGAVYCTKFALPYLIKQKGTIIGVSSISGLTPLPGRTVYVASKYALDGFMNTLRIENKNKGLKVLLVHPSFTESNIRNIALNKNGVPQHETTKKEKQLMSSETVANIILKAYLKNKRDIVISTKGKLFVWIYKHFPVTTDRFIYNKISKEPNSLFIN